MPFASTILSGGCLEWETVLFGTNYSSVHFGARVPPPLELLKWMYAAALGQLLGSARHLSLLLSQHSLVETLRQAHGLATPPLTASNSGAVTSLRCPIWASETPAMMVMPSWEIPQRCLRHRQYTIPQRCLRHRRYTIPQRCLRHRRYTLPQWCLRHH